MSFLDWYYVLEALVAKEARERERKRERESFPRLDGPPYRHSDEKPPSGPETAEHDFVAVFRSGDGTEFSCTLVAVFSAASASMVTREARVRVCSCLKERLRRESRFSGGTEILAVIREFVRIVCLGERRLPEEVMGSLPGGVHLSDVRLVRVTVDSDVGRPIIFRFER